MTGPSRFAFQSARAGAHGIPLATLLVTLFLLLAATNASAHGVDYHVERGEAVVVRFSSHHLPPLADAGFRVFAPDRRTLFLQGRTDALGRAVFVPDAPGTWRLLMATDDGHGAEVEVVVSAGQLALDIAPQRQIAPAGRLSATAAGIGYVLGLGGLLMLWRRRRDL